MILSKRERFIAIAAAGVLGLLAADYYVLGPILSQRKALAQKITAQTEALSKDLKLVKETPEKKDQWERMLALGLKTDASAAESQVLHAVRDWAADSGLNLSSVKPEKSEQEKQFQKITFRATGVGNMNAVSRFLWKIQTSSIPVRIADVAINSRKDGVDDLSLQLGISTIIFAPEPEKPVRGSLATVREERP